MREWSHQEEPGHGIAGGTPPRGVLCKYIPPDERVVLWLRPSLMFILIRGWWGMAAVLLVGWGVWRLGSWGGSALLAATAVWVSAAAGVLVLLWEVLEWFSRRYVLTDRRLLCIAGVLNQNVADVPVRNVRNLVIVRGVMQRLLGLGTLGAATAGTAGYELVWLYVRRPHEVLAVVRGAVDRASKSEMPSSATGVESVPVVRQGEETVPGGPIVIGLTGGIGAGKSEVAKALGERGFVVVDSDKEAKAALDRPAVREELIRWWGDRVLGGDGRVDRKAVAEIIFGDGAERARLERLVHPLVKATRAELVDRAARERRPGVVVDAPLLLEAGSDGECDVVVFVDSPRAQRLERVRATRGWDEAELERREKAQLSLEEKRRRSDEVICNDSTAQNLRGRVAELLSNLHNRRGGAG